MYKRGWVKRGKWVGEAESDRDQAVRVAKWTLESLEDKAN